MLSAALTSGPVRQQEFHNLLISFACRQDQRCITDFTVFCVGVSPVEQQRFHHISVVCQGRIVQGRQTLLVASIHLGFADATVNLQYRGPNRIACRATLQKGDEMGYFRLGSTILVLATAGLMLVPTVRESGQIRFGEPLLCHRAPIAPTGTR